MKRKNIYKIVSVAAALLIWELVARKVNMKMLLASPTDVLARLAVIWKEATFWRAILFSTLRITLGFFFAAVFGMIIGIFAGYFKPLEYLMWPYVSAMKAVPVASFIIIALLWMDTAKFTVLITFLIAFPTIYSNVLQGIRSRDEKLKELAKVYKIPKIREFHYIAMPAVRPYLLTSVKLGTGMAWKAGIAAEVIGMVEGSIGEKLYDAKVYFLNADLLAWTIIIVLLSIISEKILSRLLELLFKGAAKI